MKDRCRRNRSAGLHVRHPVAAFVHHLTAPAYANRTAGTVGIVPAPGLEHTIHDPVRRVGAIRLPLRCRESRRGDRAGGNEYPFREHYDSCCFRTSDGVDEAHCFF